ncbi:hypothetical protein J6590_035038 [Homalodisca vitripennis]|nr:hypothetical protein J6590_035038 [Homalodisca vitripennis]
MNKSSLQSSVGPKGAEPSDKNNSQTLVNKQDGSSLSSPKRHVIHKPRPDLTHFTVTDWADVMLTKWLSKDTVRDGILAGDTFSPKALITGGRV